MYTAWQLEGAFMYVKKNRCTCAYSTLHAVDAYVCIVRVCVCEWGACCVVRTNTCVSWCFAVCVCVSVCVCVCSAQHGITTV